MAEGTSMKTIEENIEKLEQLQQQHAIMLNQWMKSTNSNLEEFRKEIPSFETKIQEHELITFNYGIQESRPQIVNANSRSRILDDNLKKMKALAEQHASMMQQWWPSTNQIMTESHQEKQFSARVPSNLGVELNLEANSAKQDRGVLCSLTKDQEIEELQGLTVNFDTLVVVSEIASVEMGEVFADSIEIRGADLKLYSTEFLVKNSAHKVFAKMLEKQMAGYVELPSTIGETFGSIDSSSSFVFDLGKVLNYLYTLKWSRGS